MVVLRKHFLMSEYSESLRQGSFLLFSGYDSACAGFQPAGFGRLHRLNVRLVNKVFPSFLTLSSFSFWLAVRRSSNDVLKAFFNYCDLFDDWAESAPFKSAYLCGVKLDSFIVAAPLFIQSAARFRALQLAGFDARLAGLSAFTLGHVRQLFDVLLFQTRNVWSAFCFRAWSQ